MYTVPSARQVRDYSEFLYHATNNRDMPNRTARNGTYLYRGIDSDPKEEKSHQVASEMRIK